MPRANYGIIGPVQDPTKGSESISSFNSPGSHTTSGSTFEYLIVAGGGGAGNSTAGGGGARGMITGNQPTSPGVSLTVTVGSGGATNAPRGSNGGTSSITGSGPISLTTTGGGGGGTRSVSGNPGGSGGGGGDAATTGPPVGGGSGTPGQGNNGAGGSNDPTSKHEFAGGGGGKGSAGGSPTAPHFGTGSPSTITGSDVTYANGGAGDDTGTGLPPTRPNSPQVANTGYGGASFFAPTNPGPTLDPTTVKVGGDGVVVIKEGAFSNAPGIFTMTDIVQLIKAGKFS